MPKYEPKLNNGYLLNETFIILDPASKITSSLP